MTDNELIQKLSTFRGDLPVQTYQEDHGAQDVWEVAEENHFTYKEDGRKVKRIYYTAVVIR